MGFGFLFASLTPITTGLFPFDPVLKWKKKWSSGKYHSMNYAPFPHELSSLDLTRGIWSLENDLHLRLTNPTRETQSREDLHG